jgi:K+/H+ antiporter YhaU regulatory subunit KhtT
VTNKEARCKEEMPSLRAKRGNPENIDEIIARVQEEPADEKQSRNISIYCCRQHSGAKLKEIGKHLGKSNAWMQIGTRNIM